MRPAHVLPIAAVVLLGAVVALAVLAAAPALARADEPAPRIAVALAYKRPDGCPGEAAIRDAVANQVGYDPVVPGASRKVEVTVARDERGLFVAQWQDREGDAVWTRAPMTDPDCRRLLRRVGVSIATRIDPIVAPPGPAIAPEPTPAREPPAPAPPPPAPPVVAPVVLPLPPAPSPGVFEGPAGKGRVAAFAISGALLATGTGFAIAAAERSGAAAQALQNVEHTAGPHACTQGGGATTATCNQLVDLRTQRDQFADAGLGLLTAAAIGTAAGVASIWLVRTPAPVKLKPASPGALAGLTIQAAW